MIRMNVDPEIVADLAHWRVHTPEVSDLLQALEFQERYSLSFRDAMVIPCITG